MVDFVRPAFLGTCSDFTNRFERPIANGQCDDSSDVDKEISRQQAALLHDLLDSVVLRRTHAQAGSEIPPKIEVCLFLRCSEMQVWLVLGLFSSCANEFADESAQRFSGSVQKWSSSQ
jgi:RAD54-like protein 2